MKGDYFVKSEIEYKEAQRMIVMNVEIDNFMSFDGFVMNLSYPKKILNSRIENEFLKGFTNFRYKKVNILMGANATGKTSFGKMLMTIFNFMDKKQYTKITEIISDKTKKAEFSIDFVTNIKFLYRVRTVVTPAKDGEEITGKNIDVSVQCVEIKKKDSYERCVERLKATPYKKCNNYLEELEKVTGLTWTFAYPEDYNIGKVFHAPNDSSKFQEILSCILMALDPAIISVDRLSEVEGAYAIRTESKSAIIQDGQIPDIEWLSSGTKAGIAVAIMIADILERRCTFFYCDEKFSYIHSDIEKAILSVMIELLGEDTQLFFTTHNTDILDMQLPKHSYTFMKKEVYDAKNKIECINAGEILKRNTDSLKSAVENDLFSTAPATEMIYDILDI